MMRPENARHRLFSILSFGLLVVTALVVIRWPASSEAGFLSPLSEEILTQGVNNAPASGVVVHPMPLETSTVTIRATDPNAAEAGPDAGEFTVRRFGDFSSPLTVYYTVGGTATNGVDYTTLSGSVTLAAGSPVATITVLPIDDALPEGDETVIVTLIGGPGYTVGSPSTATVTIADNDIATPTPTPTPTPAPQIRIADNPIGNPWLYLWDQSSRRLYAGANTTGDPIVFFETSGSLGRIFRGPNTTGQILFTVDFNTGRIWAGPNTTGPLLYTLDAVLSGPQPYVRVHSGRRNGPIVYTIRGDNMYAGPNETGALVYHGSSPFWGPVQFLLPLLADGRIP